IWGTLTFAELRTLTLAGVISPPSEHVGPISKERETQPIQHVSCRAGSASLLPFMSESLPNRGHCSTDPVKTCRMVDNDLRNRMADDIKNELLEFFNLGAHSVVRPPPALGVEGRISGRPDDDSRRMTGHRPVHDTADAA